LDAGDDKLFQAVNRPCPEVTFERLLEGLITFRREFSRAYWLEVMLLAGLTDQPDAIQALAALTREIQPDRIYLNTAVRPPAEGWVKPASAAALEMCAAAMGPKCEIIADYTSTNVAEELAGSEEQVLALLRRRPCRLEDLSTGLGMHRNEVLKYLTHLLQTGEVCGSKVGQETYYSAASASDGQRGSEG